MKLKYEESRLLLAKPMTVFQGLSLLKNGFRKASENKQLLGLSVTPVLIALISFYFFYGPLYGVVSKTVLMKFITVGSYTFWGGSVVLWVLTAFLKALSAVASFLVFYIFLQVIYIPFCSLIAEAVLRDKGIIKINGFSEMVSYNFSMIRVGLLKALLLIVIGFVLFLSSFMPFLSFLPFYFALLVLAYDSFDYGLELYGLDLSQRSTFFQKEFFMLNGHAGVLFLLSFVPGLLLLTLPFSVVGASAKLGEIYDTKRKPS